MDGGTEEKEHSILPLIVDNLQDFQWMLETVETSKARTSVFSIHIHTNEKVNTQTAICIQAEVDFQGFPFFYKLCQNTSA